MAPFLFPPWALERGPGETSFFGAIKKAWTVSFKKKKESMDSELQECFNLALRNGINLFDTADSYGTGKLNGQSERLLGRFIREFEG